MSHTNESPLADGVGKGGGGTTAYEQEKLSKIKDLIQALDSLAPQRNWLAQRDKKPFPHAYKERSERYTLQVAFETVEDLYLDGVCLYIGDLIYQEDGRRLVVFNIYTTEPIESLPFDFLRRVPSYIEKTDFGYRTFYWLPDAWAAQYYGVAHIWLDSGSEIEIQFGPDRSKKPFLPLTFDVVGKLHPIAAPDETLLDDCLGSLLKDEEKPLDCSAEESTVPFPPPFLGPMTQAVDAALEAEYAIQPELTTLAALIGMAAGCGSCYVLPGGGRLNLYGCGIAATGDGKDRPRKLAVLLARQAIAQVIGKPASGQALEDVLAPRVGMLCEIDEIGHALAAVNGSRAPSYLIELAGNILKLFSASDSSYHTRAKAGMKAAPPVIERPAFNLIGFSTEEVLGHAVTIDDVENGLLGRFLFVQGKKNPQMRREAKPLALPDPVKAAAQRVSLSVKLGVVAGREDVPITTTPGVESLLDALFNECKRRKETSASPFARALFARSYEKVERVAGVLAVWDNPTAPVITPEHVTWAAAAVQSSDAMVLSFAERHMVKGKVQAHAAQVRKLMARILKGELKVKDTPAEIDALKQGWVPRASILRHAKNMDAKELAEAIRYLDEMREIEWGRLVTTHARGHQVDLEVVRPFED